MPYGIWMYTKMSICIDAYKNTLANFRQSIFLTINCATNWNLFYEHQPFGGAYFIEDSAGR